MASDDDRKAMATALQERATRLLQLDYFAALEVPRTAGAEEVAKAYLAAAKVFHPDRSPSPDLAPLLTKVFARLDLAKATLSEPARRKQYLAELEKPAWPGARAGVDAEVEFKKGEAYAKTNDPTRAEQHLRRAVRLAPSNVAYAVALVAVQATPEATPARLRELAAELDALVARAPDSDRALLQRGQLLKRLGRQKEAIADFTRVVELNPSSVEAARELRLHKMRTAEKAAPTPEASGIGGVLRKLFGRK